MLFEMLKDSKGLIIAAFLQQLLDIIFPVFFALLNLFFAIIWIIKI